MLFAILDARTLGLVGGVLLVLGVASIVVQVLRRRTDLGLDPGIIENVHRRVRAWLILFAGLTAAFVIGRIATVVLFGLIGFWALREFITLTPTRPGDHRTLFWVFFLITPLQFVLVGWGREELFGTLIPVYAFLLIPARIAISGDPKRFLERTAKIQCGLLICVYCLSHAPALLTLRPPLPPSATHEESDAMGSEAASPTEIPVPLKNTPIAAGAESDPYRNTRLLFFFVLMVQLSDVAQYLWSQIPSRHPIAPTINPSRTWEGLLGGTATAMLIGGALWWATPFQGVWWWMAALMSGVISLMGFAGGITMSAIKRDRGVKDYGTLIEGHSGILDRIDSLCFAAPVFFHCTRLWLGV